MQASNLHAFQTESFTYVLYRGSAAVLLRSRNIRALWAMDGSFTFTVQELRMFSLESRSADLAITDEALRWMDEMKDLRQMSPAKSKEFIAWLLENRKHLAEILRLQFIKACVWRVT